MNVKYFSQSRSHIRVLIAFAALFPCNIVATCLASGPAPVSEPPAFISVSGAPEAACETAASSAVTIARHDDGYRLYRGGQPYYIKGIGGSRRLGLAANAGANSVRCWGSDNAGNLLDRAREHEMTVMLGIWLSHNPADYLDPDYKRLKTEEVQRVLNAHRQHPALLMWALGNEINLGGADTPAAWGFVNDLARLIKSQDPYHPVISVIANGRRALDNIAAHAPELDAVGINAYGALSGVRAMIDASAYTGPYMITEWGVDGHWEVERTRWGRPIEPTSAQKADFHLKRYERHILANRDRCIGSYVFLWGQKQERTPTWYSMFIENFPDAEFTEVACPTVDVMHFNWSGSWPTNRAPQVDAMTINGSAIADGITLAPGEPFVAGVTASDPDNDGLRYVWELMKEPDILGRGGSREPRPDSLGEVMKGNLPEISGLAPEQSGEYRLFVYVLDPKGHVGTANVPIQVDVTQTASSTAGQPPSSDG